MTGGRHATATGQSTTLDNIPTRPGSRRAPYPDSGLRPDSGGVALTAQQATTNTPSTAVVEFWDAARREADRPQRSPRS